MKKRTLEKGEIGFISALGLFSLICMAASLRLFLKSPTLNGEGTVPLITSVILLAMTFIILIEIRGCPRGEPSDLSLGHKAKEVFNIFSPALSALLLFTACSMRFCWDL